MTHGFAIFLTQIAARSAVVLIALVIGLRVFGKRQLGQMHLIDLVTILCIANAVQNAMTGGTGDLLTGIVSAGVLIVLGRIHSEIVVRRPSAEPRIVGSPTILLSDGKIIRDRMRREEVTDDEVLAALRAHGLTKPSQARLVVLEVDGDLSVVPKEGT